MSKIRVAMGSVYTVNRALPRRDGMCRSRRGTRPLLSTRYWPVMAMVIVVVTALTLTSARARTADVMVGVKQNMHAVLITPDGGGPYPAILLLHTSGGLKQADLDYGQRLSQQGYVVLVPAFLAAYGITPRERRATFTTDADAIYADFVAALDMLERNPQVAGSKLGAIGFSNGGYFAIWLAATGKVRAGVSYYGALTGAGTDRGLRRFETAFNKSSAPVLILHGMVDGTVPVTAAQRLGQIVAAAGSPYEMKLYDGVGHSFDRVPSDSAAAVDAWQRTVAFFAKYLKGQ